MTIPVQETENTETLTLEAFFALVDEQYDTEAAFFDALKRFGLLREKKGSSWNNESTFL